MAAREEAKATGQGDEAARWRVVVATSALGLYVDGGGGSHPYVRDVAGCLKATPSSIQAPTPTVKVSANAKDKGAKNEPQARQVRDAPATLNEALLVRGPQLI